MISHAIGFFKQAKYPILLRKSPYSTLWYKPDLVFLTPKAYVKIDFSCPHACDSPEAEVLNDLFTELLMDYLNEYGKISMETSDLLNLFLKGRSNGLD